MRQNISTNKCENICIAITLVYCLIITLLNKENLMVSETLIALALLCKLHRITNNIRAKSIISVILSFPYTLIILGILSCIGSTIHNSDFLLLLKTELQLSPLLFAYICLLSLCMGNIPELQEQY